MFSFFKQIISSKRFSEFVQLFCFRPSMNVRYILKLNARVNTASSWGVKENAAIAIDIYIYIYSLFIVVFEASMYC